VSAASFNGLNVLNGSVASLNFVSGFNASSNGGTINTISFATQALYGLTTGVGDTESTSTSSISDATGISQVQAQWTAVTGKTDAISTTAPAATYGTALANEDTTNQVLTVQQQQADGSWLTTTYTALAVNGNSVADGGTPTFAT